MRTRRMTLTRIGNWVALVTLLAACVACDTAGDGGFSGDPDAIGPSDAEASDAGATDAAAGDVLPDGEFPKGFIPEGATEIEIEAINRVNWYRWRVGLPPIDLDRDVSQVAQRHCECWYLHREDYRVQEISPHDELPSWSERTCAGVSVGDRMEANGITGVAASEVIAFLSTPAGAVDGWVETLYHRLPITSPTTEACGYGEKVEGSCMVPIGQSTNCINTMNCLHATTNTDTVVLYPEDGAVGIPTSWDGAENPQPPPPPQGYPSGPIITLYRGGVPFTTESHEILSPEGSTIPHMFLDGTNDTHLEGERTVCLYPNRPLEPGTTYTVRVGLAVTNGTETVEWSFTTAE